MLRRRLTLAIAIAFGIFFPVALFAATGTIDPTAYQSRQCSNAGCSPFTQVYWRTTNGTPVSVSDTALTGTIWSSQFGWINLNPTNGGVHNTTSGILSGYAWGATIGWINFAPTNGGVTINTTTGEFSGYAWASGAGWMRFDCSLGATVCVKTDWRPAGGTTTTTGTTGSTGTTGGCRGTCGGTTTTGTGTTGTTTGDSTTTTGTTGTTTTTGTTGSGTTTSGTTTGTTTSGTTTGTTTSGTGTTGTTTGTTTTTTGTTTASGTTTGTTSGSTGTGTTTGSGGTGTTNGGCGEITDTSVGGVILGEIRNSYCRTKDIVLDTVAKLALIMQGEGGKLAAIGATIAVVGAAMVTIASVLFVNPVSFSELLLLPARLWSLLLGALGLKKRQRPWGTVYDSVTKQPLDPVYVTLRDTEGTEVTSSITDLDGRFGFVVPKPGTYSIFVHKTNYLFPSQKLVGQDHDELYRDLYFGEYFKVENAGDAVYKNVPMDAEHFDWNEYAKKEQSLMKFYSKRDKILGHISDVLFGVGFVLATLAILFAPQPYNIAIFALYIVLFFVRRSSVHSRPFGDITDAAGVPLAYALIRISSATTDVEVMHRIADAKGRYYALLPNGEYRVRIDRKNPDGKYTTVATGLPATVDKGFMAKKFSV